jgi:hypothetical protein
LPPGSTSAPQHRPDRVGQRLQRGHRYGQLRGERPWPAAADADLEPVGAHVLSPAGAPGAAAAAEHGVARDPAAEPGVRHSLTGGADPPGPFVPDPQRVGGLAGVQVGHRAGEELDVGAAEPGALDIDDDLARACLGRVDVMHPGFARSGDDERAHASAGRQDLLAL